MNLIDCFEKLFLNPRELRSSRPSPGVPRRTAASPNAGYEELNEAAPMRVQQTVSPGSRSSHGQLGRRPGPRQATAAPTTTTAPSPAGSSPAPTSPLRHRQRLLLPSARRTSRPAEIVPDIVNRYVTEVYETNAYVTDPTNETTVYDNDTNVDNSVTTVVDARKERRIVEAIANDNDATTASSQKVRRRSARTPTSTASLRATVRPLPAGTSMRPSSPAPTRASSTTTAR